MYFSLVRQSKLVCEGDLFFCFNAVAKNLSMRPRPHWGLLKPQNLNHISKNKKDF